ncbi:MAG: PilW family protein [Litorivicinus sp.]
MRVRGLSLVELMISLALGSLIVLAALTLLSTQSSQLRDQVQKTTLQESGRLSLDLIGAHIRLAGFYGTMDEGDGLTNVASVGLAAGSGCTGLITTPGQVIPTALAAASGTNAAQGLVVRQFATVLEATGTYDCINAANIDVSSPVLEIHSVDGVPVMPQAGVAPPNDGYYVQASPGGGQLFFGVTDYDALVASFQDRVYADGVTPVEVMRWQPAIYYVKPCSVVNGNCTGVDGIPSLVRQRLVVPSAGAAPRMMEEILIEGVERIEYSLGIGTAGQLERFVAVDDPLMLTNSAGDWAEVLAVRVTAVVRELGNHDNSATLTSSVTLPSGTTWNCNQSTTGACDSDRSLYTGTFNIRNRLL